MYVLGSACTSHQARDDHLLDVGAEQASGSVGLIVSFETAASMAARRSRPATGSPGAAGSGAVDFEGQHIDLAHVRTAQGGIDLAEAVGGA